MPKPPAILCAEVCAAVIGDSAHAQPQLFLEALERTNLFLISLDGNRHWYRYHHFFANLLRQRLQRRHLPPCPPRPRPLRDQAGHGAASGLAKASPAFF